MPTVFVDSRPPSPMIRSPPRPLKRSSTRESNQGAVEKVVEPSRSAAPVEVQENSSSRSPPRPTNAPSAMVPPFGYGAPWYPYGPWPHVAAPPQAWNVNLDPSSSSPARRDAVEPLDRELSARLEAKSAEIDSLTKQVAGLKDALRELKESFHHNADHLRACQTECSRLDGDKALLEQRLCASEDAQRTAEERAAEVDRLISEERQHGVRVADELRKQLQEVSEARAAADVVAAQATQAADALRHDIQALKKQHAHELEVAVANARSTADGDASERIRAAKVKVDDRESVVRQLENELLSARAETQRQVAETESAKVKLAAAQSAVLDAQHASKELHNRLEESQRMRTVEVDAQRRDLEAARVSRDELKRACDAQLLTATQETAKRLHEIELLQQQVSALKTQGEQESRRHRAEVEDLQRGMDSKLHAAHEQTRAAERAKSTLEDALDRVRKQLADERAGRDVVESERDSVLERIGQMQRAATRREADVTRLEQHIGSLHLGVEEKTKEAEQMQTELDIRQAREKKELSVALDRRLKEYRSLSRMRSQSSALTAEASPISVLQHKIDEVSQIGLETTDIDVPARGTPRPPLAHSTPHREELVSDAETVQRYMERQLAAERDRNEELHRRLLDVTASATKAPSKERPRTTAALSDSLNAAEAAVARARAIQPTPASTPGKAARPASQPSPRASRLRDVAAALDELRVREHGHPA